MKKYRKCPACRISEKKQTGRCHNQNSQSWAFGVCIYLGQDSNWITSRPKWLKKPTSRPGMLKQPTPSQNHCKENSKNNIFNCWKNLKHCKCPALPNCTYDHFANMRTFLRAHHVSPTTLWCGWCTYFNMNNNQQPTPAAGRRNQISHQLWEGILIIMTTAGCQLQICGADITKKHTILAIEIELGIKARMLTNYSIHINPFRLTGPFWAPKLIILIKHLISFLFFKVLF